MKRKYERPPVTEVACQLIFESSAWDPTIPGLFYDKVRDKYPIKRAIQKVGIEVNLSGQAATHQLRKEADTMQFVNEKDARIVQISSDLVVINQLRPYPESFELWKPVIVKMFDLYRTLATPKRLSGLSLHYLNQIVIPSEHVNLPDYFQIFPKIPKTLEDHGNYFLRLEAASRYKGHKLIVTFGSAPVPGPQTSAHILDLFDQYEFQDESGFNALDEKLKEAHDNIESAFEESITEKSRQLFGEGGKS